VRKLLGLELDLEAFHALAQARRCSQRRVERFPGFRPPLAPDPFEALVSSITAQQVSLHAAFAVRSRFVDRFGEPAALPSPSRPVSGWRSRRRTS
jgi:3-methyladenine DNA glycosylase/8-oxoguanine DNA glycosylase